MAVQTSQFVAQALEDRADDEPLHLTHSSCTHRSVSLVFGFSSPDSVWKENLRIISDQELCELIACADFLDVPHILHRHLFEELCKRLLSMDTKSKGVMVCDVADRIATKSLELGFIKQTQGLLADNAKLEILHGSAVAVLDSLAAWESHLPAIGDNELCLLTTCASTFNCVDYTKAFLREVFCRMTDKDRQEESRKAFIVASGSEIIDLLCDPTCDLLLQITHAQLDDLCSVVDDAFGTHVTDRLKLAFDLPSWDACTEYAAAVPTTMEDVDEGLGLAATQAMVRLVKSGTMSPVGQRRMFAVLVREMVLARIPDRVSDHELRSRIPLPNRQVLFRSLGRRAPSTPSRVFGAWREDTLALQLVLCRELPLAEVRGMLQEFFFSTIPGYGGNLMHIALEIAFSHPEALADPELVDVLLQKLSVGTPWALRQVMGALEQAEWGVPTDEDNWQPNSWGDRFPDTIPAVLAARVMEVIPDYWAQCEQRRRERAKFIGRKAKSYRRGYLVDPDVPDPYAPWGEPPQI